MVIFINDEKREVKPSISVFELLDDLSLNEAPGTAVAVNNQIVLQKNRSTTLLKENDNILIINASKGG